MEKVQTGQVIEFYSNSCLVKTKFGKFECIAIKNIVVGDFVNLEIIQDSKKFLGKILKINQRSSSLTKSYNGKEKLFGFFVGQVMKETKGSADPKEVNKLLVQILKQ